MRDPDQSYSLTNLEYAIEDALTSDCTPEEIYETIRTTLRRTLTYHRVCVRTANEVLRLVHGTEHKDKVISLHEQELDETLEEKPMNYQDMIDAGYEMSGEGIWWPKEGEPLPEVTPDYDNPYVCAKIDELAGDNRN